MLTRICLARSSIIISLLVSFRRIPVLFCRPSPLHYNAIFPSSCCCSGSVIIRHHHHRAFRVSCHPRQQRPSRTRSHACSDTHTVTTNTDIPKSRSCFLLLLLLTSTQQTYNIITLVWPHARAAWAQPGGPRWASAPSRTLPATAPWWRSSSRLQRRMTATGHWRCAAGSITYRCAPPQTKQ